MAKYLCIIQARTGSTRLPGKVLKTVGGVTLLEYMVRRVRLAKRVDKIVIATTVNPADDKIASLCKKIGVAYFRGSESDVLERYYRCALNYPGYNYIMRLTSDCPLIDPAVVDQLVDYYHHNPRLDYASNNLKKTFPHGMDAEIFTKTALEESALKAALPADREHVDEYILRNRKFKKGGITAEADWSHFRLTIDYPEDFSVMKFLIEHTKPTAGYLEYVSWLSRYPKVFLMNLGRGGHRDVIKRYKQLKYG